MHADQEAASRGSDVDDDRSQSAAGGEWGEEEESREESLSDSYSDVDTEADAAVGSSTALLRLQQAMTFRDVKLDALKEDAQVRENSALSLSLAGVERAVVFGSRGSTLNHATAQMNHKLAHQAAFHQQTWSRAKIFQCGGLVHVLSNKARGFHV